MLAMRVMFRTYSNDVNAAAQMIGRTGTERNAVREKTRFVYWHIG